MAANVRQVRDLGGHLSGELLMALTFSHSLSRQRFYRPTSFNDRRTATELAFPSALGESGMHLPETKRSSQPVFLIA